MDVLFAFTGDKFAVVVSDTTSVQQIIVQKDDEEKTLDLDSHKLLAMSGPKGDCVHFGEYVQANMKLYELKNGHKLSTHAAMSFIRGELAAALRKGPYQVNMLLAGCARASVRRLRFLRRVRIVRSSSLARSLPIPSVVVRARASRRASPRGAVVLLRRASIAPRRGPPRDPVPPPTMTNLISLLPQSLSPSSDRYDEHEDDASLYFIDYLASTQKVNSGGHGYGGMFCLSLFDKHWKPKMTRAEADALVDMCIAEVRERLVTAPAKYHVKIVDKTGTSCTLYDCVEKAAEKARMAA
jgi:20S proteasome alpha/beta subunit